MQEIYIIIRQNGEIIELPLTEDNKYDIYITLEKEYVLNNSYIFLRNGYEEISTWNGCLKISSNSTIQQEIEVKKILKIAKRMKSFYSESYEEEYNFKDSDTKYHTGYNFLAKVDKDQLLHYLVTKSIMIIPPENNPINIVGFETEDITSEEYKNCFNEYIKGIHFEHLNEWLISLNNFGMVVCLRESLSQFNLYLPFKLTFAQKSIIAQLIFEYEDIFSNIIITQNNCLVNLAEYPSAEEILDNVDFSTKNEETLTLKQNRL